MFRNKRRRSVSASRNRLASTRGGLRFEPLEPRLVLDGSSLVINEFMAINDTALADDDTDFMDWLEIHNPSEESVDLTGWYLTDDAGELDKWQFPSVALDAGEYLIVFASDKDRTDPAAQLHTGFKLSGGGEYLGLVRPDGITVVHSYAPEYPSQTADVSFGLSADQSTSGYFPQPTPGEPNLADPIGDPTRHVVISEIMYHPASEDILDEYIELSNRGPSLVNMAGWQIVDGVDFTFPNVSLASGEYLVVAADLATFAANYTVPFGTTVVGGWEGRLSNSGESIEVVDSVGVPIDQVTYADQGDWSVRELGPLDFGHDGWIWSDEHDGGGQSLELVNFALPNEYGQNWAASDAGHGPTPGEANMAAQTDVAPLIQDVSHGPAVPRSDEEVTVTARLIDELPGALTAAVHFRDDGAPDFAIRPMYDNGQNGDAIAGDGTYSAVLPARPDGTVVEFYVRVEDSSGNARSWPAPVRPSGQQAANVLYQVDNTFDAAAQWNPESPPIYRLIMTEADRAELEDIGDGGDPFTGEGASNAQMNATFISIDGTGTGVRYNVGVRNRGNRSRVDPPMNYRVNFSHDTPWHDVTALNLNSKFAFSQVIGSAIWRMAGLPAPEAAAVQVRVNGEDLSQGDSSRMYGVYAAVEVYDSDWADNHFADDSNGNLYRCTYDDDGNADLLYQGDDPDAYRDNYPKKTNRSVDDWSDLINLTYVLNDGSISDEDFLDAVGQVIDVEQWMRYLAVDALSGNLEGGLTSGRGDDFAMYAGMEDARFRLLPHDLDTLFGQGDHNPEPNRDIWTYDGDRLEGVHRLLNHPEVVSLYYRQYLDLIDTVFAPENFNPFVDQVLQGAASQSVIDGIKQFAEQRRAGVLAQIPQDFTITSNLPITGGYHRTDRSVADLSGTASGAYTRSVLVGGQTAQWDIKTGQWQIDSEGGDTRNVLFASGSVWRYMDDGTDQASAWYAADFDDSVWSMGPAQLGYGDGDDEATVISYGDDASNRHITTYFRTEFDVGDLSEYSGLVLRLLRDDGAVVYLNGEEVVRSNMPTGAVAYDTVASSNVGGADEDTFFAYALDIGRLTEGTNILAVEIHQANPTSADVSFDLSLEATIPGVGTGVLLSPGINRVLVEAFDGPAGTGNHLDQGYIDIWYDDGSESTLSGTLAAANTLLDAESGPWRITGDVTVASGATLTIEPGTTLFFDAGTRITIASGGRLVAEGTPFERIRLTRQPGSSTTWDGLYISSAEDNRLSYADMDYSTAGSRSIGLSSARMLIDNVTWANTTETVLSISSSSVIVRNSIFPGTNSQTVSGHYLLPSDPYMLFENNVFGICTGYKEDVLDFSTSGAETMPRFIGNLFLGGGDDALDLDGTNAYVEGNVFMNFHRNFDAADGESYAVTSGYDGPHSSNHVIVRNIFIDLDNAALVKAQSWIDFQNNTIIGADVGINFDEPQEAGIDPGVGAYLDGNIFWDTPTPLAHFYVDDPVWGTTDITVNRSIMPEEWHTYGIGNLAGDPRVADPESGNVNLLPGSFALAGGPNGIDMGAIVPAGASIDGEPPETSSETTATLTIAGPGIVEYKYRLGDGAWSDPTSVDLPITLTDLADGQYSVSVVGQNAAGDWQSEQDAAVSKTWTVDTTRQSVRINEVLAHNESFAMEEGTLPDLIELYNDGGVAVDLAGMSLSDDASRPGKFVLPAGTTIQPGEYLVLYADDRTDLPGLHTGFALDDEGEGVFLFDTPANAATPLDAVEFGLQLADLSIGRIGHSGEWGLTQPSFGSANTAQPTGDPTSLSVNEWLADGELLFADDFVELYNPDPLPVALGDLFITDDPVGRPMRHAIAPLSFVSGSGFATFVADGDTEEGANHLAFRLSSNHEMIGLFDADLNEIDKVIYHPQTTDVSQGRQPDGTNNIVFFPLPTPGAASGTVQTVSTRPVQYTDDWSYDQSGSDLGTAWREAGYDDSTWSVGSGLLYVENSALPEDKGTELTLGSLTYYFRKHFTFDGDPSEVTQLELSTVIDDGAVVYLNGVEVLRLRMAAGDVNFDTTANQTVTDANYEGPFSIPTGALLSGDNVLAVEVHQTNADSSDVVFGLQLDTTTVTQSNTPTVQGQELLDGLRITELMYHPSDDDLEFVELQNVGETALQLGGVRFADGIDFQFPEMILAPGQYIVVVRDLAAFYNHYGSGVNVAGQYAGGLSNSGESLVLQLPLPSPVATLSAAIMRFEYDDAWYPATDGDGEAMVIVDPAAHPLAWNDPGQWQAGNVVDGTPGRADGSASTPGIVINEVLTHTDLPQVDAIELFNRGVDPIDLGGWYLTDSDTNYQKFRIPDGTIIPGGGYVVFDETHFNSTPTDPGPNDFALNGAHGDNVWLVEADAAGQVTRFVDYVEFGAAANGVSLGRWPNGTGGLFPMDPLSLGEENVGPLAGDLVISELHYHPTEPAAGTLLGDDELEFVELYNRSATTLDLSGWRLAGGVDLTFDQGPMLASGATLVAVRFDPTNAAMAAEFRAAFSADSTTTLVGPYDGQLENNGETIRLERPDESPLDEPGYVPYILVDEVSYDDRAPWPSAADGSGDSLTRTAPEAFGNFAESWTAEVPTPGQVDVSDDAYEPNNSLATAFEPGQHWAAMPLSSLSGPGIQQDDDWYLIEVPSGAQRLTVDLSFSHATGNVDLALYAADGSLLVTAESDTDNERLDVAVPSAGPWYLCVYGAAMGTAYDLVWDTQPLHPGDADLSGATDLSDFNIWNANKFIGGTTWAEGDFNGDGITDLSDFNIWNANKFTSQTVPVPPPTTSSLHDVALAQSPGHTGNVQDLPLEWVDFLEDSRSGNRQQGEGNKSEQAVDRLLATYWQ